MTEHKSPILRFSQKELTELFESGEAQVVSQKKKMEFCTPDDLVTYESEAWENFLGKKINIPGPPMMLWRVLDDAKKIGFNNFDPHYLPQIRLNKKDFRPLIDFSQVT